MSANLTPTESPTVEMVARVYHALSDEAIDGIALNSPDCVCRYYARHVQKVVDLFLGKPIPEPEGLGAVVVNPFTDDAWVRAAHPALPWHDPATAAPQEWASATTEDWYLWEELPGPLVMQSPGWTPPRTVARPSRARRSVVPEPVGIGAVVLDAAGDAWVRLHGGDRPWVPADAGADESAAWEVLPHPVTIRSHGWVRS